MELLDRIRALCQATFDSLAAPGERFEWQASYCLYADGKGAFPIVLLWLSMDRHSTWHWIKVEQASDSRVHWACQTMWTRVVSNRLMWQANLEDAYEEFEDAT